jgi:hypothetical protein
MDIVYRVSLERRLCCKDLLNDSDFMKLRAPLCTVAATTDDSNEMNSVDASGHFKWGAMDNGLPRLHFLCMLIP